MKKIFLVFCISLFVVACGNGGNIIKNVDDLKVLHPQDFHELATMFDELTYEYDAVYSSEKHVVTYTYGGQENLNGNMVSKLIFDLSGEEAIIYLNNDGEEVKVSHRENTYTQEDEGLRFTLMEIKSKMPRIFNSPSDHITKRDRDRDTLISTEQLTINNNKGSKEIYEDEHESSITGEVTNREKHLGIFDEFMIMLYEKVDTDNHHSEFEITSFKVK